MIKTLCPWLSGALLFAGWIQAQPVEIQIELMNQIGTDSSRRGDIVSGRVLSPVQLQNDIIEGRITESKSGAKIGGQSVFSFSFDTLRHAGAAIPITSQLRSVTNSKGRANVDEEGRMVRRGTGNVAKVAGGTGAGALIGGLVGGGKGAAIGAAAGAGTSVLLVQVAADAPNIRFAPGTRMVIEANTRNGSSLAALSAPAYPAAPAASATPVVPAANTLSAADIAPPAPPPAASAPAAPAAPPTPPDVSRQPEMTVLKSTFIPGEKTIFYDDFTDMSPQDAPPHFKIRGSSPELRAAGAIRQLTVTQRGSIFPNVTALPKNFTYEAEISVDSPKRAIATLILLTGKNQQALTLSTSAMPGTVDLAAAVRLPYQDLGRKRASHNWNEPAKLAVWVQDGRLRVFVNGEKHLDFNQVNLPPITGVEFAHDFYGANQAIGYRSVRFAESAPDFSQTITSSGRYVTHGILFDTDSDRLKPESAPVIQTIAKGLEANPNLKFLIEGHTDATGNAGHNMDLSKRRAEAVKSVLSAQFNIDAARLTTAGLGASKPIDTNDTPQGRSQNRRVEFVRQ